MSHCFPLKVNDFRGPSGLWHKLNENEAVTSFLPKGGNATDEEIGGERDEVQKL